MSIDEATLDNDRWYQHPTEKIKINESGTHIYHLEREKFLTIRRYTWKTRDWVEHKVSLGLGKDRLFHRLALECFGGKLLGSLTCEHIDCDRTNNSRQNLKAATRLYQANAKKIHKSGVDNQLPLGVREVPQDGGWSVSVRIYTPGETKISIEQKKWFGNSQYPGGREEAKQAAIDYRNKYTLREGMH